MNAKNCAAPIFFIVAVLAYPLLFRSEFALGAGITVAGFAIGTIGFVLLLGLAHQLAIGQAAFYMIGGYGSAILTTRYGFDGLSAAGVSALAAVAIAYAVGYPILKLRGFVLAIASLALHLLFIAIAILLVSITGGSSGIPAVPRFSIGGWVLSGDTAYYLFAWAMVALMLVVGANIDRSRIGRALRALAANEAAAAASGINTTHYKVLIFVISAAMGSVGGSVLTHYLRVVDPSVFGMQFSLDIITAVIIGGLHSVWGGVVGAGLVVLLREALRLVHQPEWEVIVIGALTVIVLIGFPAGVVGAIARLFNRAGTAGGANFVASMVSDTDTVTAPMRTEMPFDGPVLKVDGAVRSFGSLRAVSNVGFHIAPNEIVALIGPNGAGKTTMLDMISGHQGLDQGSIAFRGQEISRRMPDEIGNAGIARTFQAVRIFDNMSVLENVMCGNHGFGRTGIAAIGLRLPHVRAEERRLRAHALRELEFVGLADAASLKPGQLPFGHQRMIELARALALAPSLLLLDEPASGLNDSETEQLADLLIRIRARGITILLVEHDVRLVMGLADRIVVMDHGEKIAEGTPDVVRANPQVIEAYLGAAA